MLIASFETRVAIGLQYPVNENSNGYTGKAYDIGGVNCGGDKWRLYTSPDGETWTLPATTNEILDNGKILIQLSEVVFQCSFSLGIRADDTRVYSTGYNQGGTARVDYDGNNLDYVWAKSQLCTSCDACAFSETSKFRIALPPATPGGPISKLSSTETSIEFLFEPVNTFGAELLGYEFYFIQAYLVAGFGYTTPLQLSLPASTRTYNVTGLITGARYRAYYQVRSEVGLSDPTTNTGVSGLFFVGGKPEAPDDPYVMEGVGCQDSCDLKWNKYNALKNYGGPSGKMWGYNQPRYRMWWSASVNHWNPTPDYEGQVVEPYVDLVTYDLAPDPQVNVPCAGLPDWSTQECQDDSNSNTCPRLDRKNGGTVYVKLAIFDVELNEYGDFSGPTAFVCTPRPLTHTIHRVNSNSNQITVGWTPPGDLYLPPNPHFYHSVALEFFI